jgi:hypothetical protein
MNQILKALEVRQVRLVFPKQDQLPTVSYRDLNVGMVVWGRARPVIRSLIPDAANKSPQPVNARRAAAGVGGKYLQPALFELVHDVHDVVANHKHCGD